MAAPRIADSDVLIDLLKGRSAFESQLLQWIAEGSLITTTLSCFEILSGIEGQRAQAGFENLLASLSVVPLDLAGARSAAKIERFLRETGNRLEPGDILIAGIAISLGLPLLTGNRRHFARVPDLELAEI